MEISVVIPVYNRGHLISKALESLVIQTYNDFDVIIAFRKTNLKEILIFFSTNIATKSEKLSTYITGGIKERRKFINNAN